MEKSQEWYALFGILIGIIFTYFYQEYGLLIITTFLIILILIRYRNKMWNSLICPLCKGKGKIKCECLDVFISGTGQKFEISKNNYKWKITGISIKNNGLPRTLLIQLILDSKYNNSLKDRDKIMIRKKIKKEIVGHSVTNIELSGLRPFEVDLGDCKNIEFLLNRSLKDSDFNVGLNIKDLKPKKDCVSCEGKGLIKCPKCNGKRIKLFNLLTTQTI